MTEAEVSPIVPENFAKEYWTAVGDRATQIVSEELRGGQTGVDYGTVRMQARTLINRELEEWVAAVPDEIGDQVA